MHNAIRYLTICFLLAMLSSLSAGCTATTRSISPEDQVHYDEAYDFSDKNKIVDALVGPLLSKSPLADTSNRPVIVVYGIANRTSEHISTDLITDDIREAMIKSGRFRFVNKVQRDNITRETEYQQAGAVDPATRVKLARQTGAQYMLTGTLRSIEKEEPRQVRLKKKSLRYYSLHIELTNLETSEIEYVDSVEIAREASKPIIGW